VVFAKSCAVVEGILGLKSKLDILVNVHSGSIQMALLDLGRRVIASDFIQKVAETFVTRILMIGIGLVTSVIVTRILGPEGRGLYAVAAAVGAIGVQSGNLGLHASNTYYVAKDRELLAPLLGNSLLVSFVFGGLGVALAWAVFYLWPALAPVHGLLLLLALVWIPLGLAYMLLQNLLLGIQEVRTYNKIELISKILGVGLIGAVIILKAVKVETLFFTGLIVLIISLTWALWRLQPHLRRLPWLSLSLLKDNIRYGIKAYLAAFFSFLVLKADLLIVKQILGAAQAGYYSIAVSMADMIYILPVVIGTILFPKLSAMTVTREKREFTKRTAVSVGLVMVILVSCAALLAKPTVWLLYGTEFLPAVPAFVWLMPAIVILSVNTVYMNYFASIGMPMIVVYSPGMATILNIALNMKLTPLLGIVGTSISSVIAYGLMMIFSLVYIYVQRRDYDR
jgi:O-antigen/teichoic acid export membrane protein